ncbi:hypothetical protein KJ652_02025, partial [Patescibacteria group bacterium]|nr:hypothetical protein [Patescibacteria group bacterium]
SMMPPVIDGTLDDLEQRINGELKAATSDVKNSIGMSKEESRKRMIEAVNLRMSSLIHTGFEYHLEYILIIIKSEIRKVAGSLIAKNNNRLDSTGNVGRRNAPKSVFLKRMPRGCRRRNLKGTA